MLESVDHIIPWKPNICPRDFGKILHDTLVGDRPKDGAAESS